MTRLTKRAMQEKLFLTVQEAAFRLGLKPWTLYAKARQGLIPHRKLGKYVRFTEDDLKQIFEKQRQK